MNRFYAFCIIGVLMAGAVHAQVGQIKTAASTRTADYRSNAGSDLGLLFVQLMVDFLANHGVEWQRETLANKYINPGVVSIEVSLQGAVQPSMYYIANPRVRANWGVFSTDFRQNYLIEEDIDGRVQHIRTDEWQVLQLNMVSTRNAIFRVGYGFIHEGYSNRETYGEFATALTLLDNKRLWGGMAEFRNSRARLEFSSQVHYRVLDRKPFQGFVTGGWVFQRYYSSVAVWGLQGGFMLRVY